ncbi:MAG: hypothetical protein JWR21_2769 [Herminiimonas sp.]|nr:hypothetical protein [Herminiimonas sp.]
MAILCSGFHVAQLPVLTRQTAARTSTQSRIQWSGVAPGFPGSVSVSSLTGHRLDRLNEPTELIVERLQDWKVMKIKGYPTHVAEASRLRLQRKLESQSVALSTHYQLVRGPEAGSTGNEDQKRLQRLRRTLYPPSLLSMNATRNPATVINPAKSCASSNASGIIVSTSIARIAPAATAVVAATISGEKSRNAV